MNRKPVKGLDNSFIGKQSKDYVLTDLIAELERDGLDRGAVNKLIRELRRQYPGNSVIITLSEALGLEAKPERSKKNLAWVKNGLKANSLKNDQPGLEGIAIATGSSEIETAVNTEKCASADFFWTVGMAGLDVQNAKWIVWAS